MAFPLLSLGKDLLGEMMNRYFDPISALRCLRVCKRLNSLGNRDLIIEKVLRYSMLLEYQEQYDKLIICPKCQTVLDTKKSLTKHLSKHGRYENQGKKMQSFKLFKESLTPCCNTISSNYTHHTCLIRTGQCHNIIVGDYYPWADILCPDKVWYKSDPNFEEHRCLARCKVCKMVFDDDFDHFSDCPRRSEMIEIYSLRGDRTDEEWEDFLETIEDDPSYDLREQKFEKEYEEWKRLQ